MNSELIEQLRGHADRIEPAPHRFVCEAQDIRCAADTIDQLSAEVERLKGDEQMLRCALESEIERIREKRDEYAARGNELMLDLGKAQRQLLEAAQRVAELEAVLPSALKEKLRSADERIAELAQRVAELESVLSGVIAEADRETVPFIRARALLATPPHGKDAQGVSES